MLDTTLKGRDEAVSPIVGALLLVAITTSLMPGLILMLDDPDTLPPDAEASWVGIRENDTAPIRHYRVEIDALYGAGPNETATIVVDDVSFQAEISIRSEIEIPCVGADPEAAIVVDDHVVTWSAMAACGTGGQGGQDPGPVPEADERDDVGRCKVIVREYVTAAGVGVPVSIEVCSGE